MGRVQKYLRRNLNSSRLRIEEDIENAVRKLTNDIVNVAKIGTPIPYSGSRQITNPLNIRKLV